MNAKRPGGFDARAPRGPAPPPPEIAPGLMARLAAAQAIADALTFQRPLDERFAAGETDPRFVGLDARDRALARSIAVVAVRRLGTIRKALAQHMLKGLPRRAGALEWILIAATAQILFLDLPDHAAVDLAVRATRLDAGAAPFAGLVNAVLRNVARAKDEVLAASDRSRASSPTKRGSVSAAAKRSSSGR